MKNINRIAGALLLLGVAAGICDNESSACTRVVYEGLDSIRIVGRSLDWKTPIPTNLYVYPAGISKKGDDKPGCVEWTSKYGAVYAVSYDGGVTEGMNEKGLVINGLFCKGTVYNGADENGRPPISLAVFVAWLLDMNATTDEVVAVLEKHDFSIGGATFDGGTVSALHWGITDASGKTAILEFDHGAVRIYDPGDKLAMTNDPEWPKMNAILDYWDKIGGKFLRTSCGKGQRPRSGCGDMQECHCPLMRALYLSYRGGAERFVDAMEELQRHTRPQIFLRYRHQSRILLHRPEQMQSEEGSIRDEIQYLGEYRRIRRRDTDAQAVGTLHSDVLTCVGTSDSAAFFFPTGRE